MRYFLSFLVLTVFWFSCKKSDEIKEEKEENGLYCISGTYEGSGGQIPISECYSSQERCFRSSGSDAKQLWSSKKSCEHRETTWCYAIASFSYSTPEMYLNCYSDYNSCKIQNDNRLSNPSLRTMYSIGCTEVSENSFIQYSIADRKAEKESDFSEEDYLTCGKSSRSLGFWAFFPPKPTGYLYCNYNENEYLTFEQVLKWEKDCSPTGKKQKRVFKLLALLLRRAALDMESKCIKSKEIVRCEEKADKCMENRMRGVVISCGDQLIRCEKNTYTWGRGSTFSPSVYELIDALTKS